MNESNRAKTTTVLNFGNDFAGFTCTRICSEARAFLFSPRTHPKSSHVKCCTGFSQSVRHSSVFLCYSVHLFAVRGEAYLLWSQKSTCQSGFFSADSERERCHTYCTSDHTETTALDNHDTSVNHVCCQDNDCHHLPLLAFVILLFLKSSFTSSAHINRLTSHGALDVWW